MEQSLTTDLTTDLTTETVPRRVLVPAREGRAVVVGAGQRLRIEDVEGQQVGDVFAFVHGDVSEYVSAAHTRGHVNRLVPQVGEEFVTTKRRPVLRLVEDTSPGVHDLLIAACDPERYAALGAEPAHASCAANLRTALGALDLTTTTVPQPINIFMRIQIEPDGALRWRPAASRAGDAVTFEALLDCVVVVSACPQDLVDVNGPGPSPLALDLLPARTSTPEGTRP